MPSRWLFSVCILYIAGAVINPAPARAQDAPGGSRASVHAVYVEGGLVVDGSLDEEVYRKVLPRKGFIQQEPREGAPATEETEAWVLFDDRNLYVAARMWDSHPERMVVNEMRRDAGFDIYNNENLGIFIDTFNDHRSGYYFMTNPLGAMRDAHVIDVTHNNGEWNAIWNPRAKRFEGGWTLEVAIPFKSIRFPTQGAQNWNIQLRRTVKWKNEHSYLTRVPAAISNNGIFWLESAVPLVGLRTPGAGRNLDIKPYATARLTTDRVVRPSISNDLDADAGIDVKYGITQGLTADFTYNTDFAQVEDDLQQVNLTRFGLFFPEKREFFIEGQGVFDFGGQTSGSASGAGDSPTMFFSRQIGLSGGHAVPILGGARLTGKVAKFSVGLVDIQTDDSDAAGTPTTNFGVVRLRRDVFGRSYVGMIATQRTPAGGDSNTLVGVDTGIAYGLSSINIYYARTRTPGLRGQASSYTGAYHYNADRWGTGVQHLVVEPNFNPEIGFLRRQDFRSTSGSLRFSPRPKGIEAVRKFSYETGFEYVTGTRGVLESRVATATFRTEFERGDLLSATAERDYEFLEAPFRIAPDVTIPAGQYAFTRGSASYQLPATSRIRGTISGNMGSFYEGTRTEARYSGRVELSHRLTLEPTLSLNWIDLPWGAFETRLLSARTTYTFSPRAALGALVQYNSSTNSLSSNIRVRWEYVPGSDLFVVYSEGRNTLVPGRFADLQSRTFVIKVTRLFRY